MAAESAEDRFSDYYSAHPRPPWDIGRPQAAFVAAAGRIGPRVLDIGCGTGDLAIWLAGQGRTVTGADFLAQPIERAREKAAAAGVEPTFLQLDALAVGELPERFDAVTDCGLFHSLDDAGRVAYVAALRKLLEPGARAFILCFSTAEPGEHGPRRISEAEILSAFADGWEIESIRPARFEVLPDIPGAEFSTGGAQAWFTEVRRA